LQEIEGNIQKNRSFYKAKAIISSGSKDGVKKGEQSTISLLQSKTQREEKLTDENKGLLRENFRGKIFLPNQIAKQSTTSNTQVSTNSGPTLKHSHIDLTNLLKKAGYKVSKVQQQSSGKKESSTSRENNAQTTQKVQNLVLKIPGPPIPAPTSSHLALFSQKNSSPKGTSFKNVFSAKDNLKLLKTSKTPKRDGDTVSKKSHNTGQGAVNGTGLTQTSSNQNHHAVARPSSGLTGANKPISSNLARFLFANNNLSKILKQAGIPSQQSKPQVEQKKKSKLGSTSQLKDIKITPISEGMGVTSRSKKILK